MNKVKEYDNGYSIEMELGENGHYVNFEIVDENDEVDIYGSLRWDGCMNWSTSEGCMYHFCEPSHADELAAMFRDVWDLGKTIMPDVGYDYKLTHPSSKP